MSSRSTLVPAPKDQKGTWRRAGADEWRRGQRNERQCRAACSRPGTRQSSWPSSDRSGRFPSTFACRRQAGGPATGAPGSGKRKKEAPLADAPAIAHAYLSVLRERRAEAVLDGKLGRDRVAFLRHGGRDAGENCPQEAHGWMKLAWQAARLRRQRIARMLCAFTLQRTRCTRVLIVPIIIQCLSFQPPKPLRPPPCRANMCQNPRAGGQWHDFPCFFKR